MGSTGSFPTTKTREAGHLGYVEPVTVAEIVLDRVQRSVRYPAGIAFQFARVRRCRADKRPDHADTVATLRRFLRLW